MRLGLGHGLDVGYRSELFGATSYLLDTYTGAAVAYSLRQLRTGVTSVVRVRRSSDNAEADFTAAEVMNGTLTTWTGANDGFVVTWYDQSGNGKNATQATAANQAKLISSGSVTLLNGLPAIDFNGGDLYTVGSVGDFNYLHNGSNASIFSAAQFGKALSPNAIYALFATQGNTTANIGCFFSYDNRTFTSATDRKFTMVARGVSGISNTASYEAVDSAIPENTQNLLSIFIDADNGTAANKYITYLNSSLTTSGNANTDAPSASNHSDPLTIGAFGDGTGSLVGYIQEFIIYDSDKSSDRAAIEAAINSHYSIY